MAVRAELHGAPSDLTKIAAMLPAGDPCVKRHDDLFFLESEALEVSFALGAGPLQDAARCLLAQVNGLARIDNLRFKPVQLAGRYEDGQGQRMAVANAGVAEAVCEVLPVTVSGGLGSKSTPPGPARMQKAALDSNVAELLQLLGQSDELSWSDLYKAFEIIRDGVGGGSDGLIVRGWTTRPELGAFTGSANHPKVSGADARHARMSGTPKSTMTVVEGRQFVAALARRWLDAT